MTPSPPDPGLTRAERLLLPAAALRGVLAGAARAITTLLLEHYIHLPVPRRPGPHRYV